MTNQTSQYRDDPQAYFPAFGDPDALHSYYVGGDGNVLVWDGTGYTSHHGLTLDTIEGLISLAEMGNK